MRRSITPDNGQENRRQYELHEAIGVATRTPFGTAQWQRFRARESIRGNAPNSRPFFHIPAVTNFSSNGRLKKMSATGLAACCCSTTSYGAPLSTSFCHVLLKCLPPSRHLDHVPTFKG